jgi:hypothetical protein
MIELADDQEVTTDDDQPNERGIMDFGRWIGQGDNCRFFPVCKCCGACKAPALSAEDLYCLDCQMPSPWELGELYRMSE